LQTCFLGNLGLDKLNELHQCSVSTQTVQIVVPQECESPSQCLHCVIQEPEFFTIKIDFEDFLPRPVRRQNWGLFEQLGDCNALHLVYINTRAAEGLHDDLEIPVVVPLLEVFRPPCLVVKRGITSVWLIWSA
jgi:hypothetical protein